MMADAEIPEFIDVMALPGVTLFPGAFLPLFIFEPRYRKMVARALDSHRMFAVGQPTSTEDNARLCPVGGVGFIRACVANPDGTSHLILQGGARVKFQEWTAIEACRHARVMVLKSHISNLAAARTRQSWILVQCERMARKNEDFARMRETFSGQGDDPEPFSDLVASMAIREATVRQRLLEELDVTARLEIIHAYLSRLAEED